MSEFTDWANAFEAKAHNRLQSIEQSISNTRWYYFIGLAAFVAGLITGYVVRH